MPRPCECDRVPGCHVCTVWHRHPNSPAARAWRGDSVAAIRADQEKRQAAVRPTALVVPPPARAAALLAPAPCAYRGDPTGETDECATCSGRIPVPLLACSLHGECFVGDYTLTGVRACARCTDRTVELVPGLLDPLPGPWRHPGVWCDSPAEADRHAAAARQLAAGPIPDPPAMSGEAVVTAGGGRYWPGVVVLARMLRECGSALPLQVWYRGSCEAVRPADVAGLGVELVDADERVGARGDSRVPRGRPTVGGWAAKLYALTHTTYERVVWLDADAYPVSDPARLLARAAARGSAVWTEPRADNINWPKVGFKDGKPAGAPPSIQGGQFALDRRACWRELLVAHWLCQHEDYYWPAGRKGWPLFGDQDALRLAFTLTGRRPHAVGPVELRRDFGVLCWLDGVLAVEHRYSAKLVAHGTPAEARAFAHLAAHLGATEPVGWLTPAEAALLRETCRGRRALEWGRFMGRSTAVIAAVASACWSVDRLPAAPAAAELARLGLTAAARLVEGDYTAPGTLPPWAPEVVFVDGEHHAAAVRRDLANAAALLAPGGLIALHDHGEPNAPDVAATATAWAAAAGWRVTAKAGTLAVLARN